jgi:hypothetical protein
MCTFGRDVQAEELIANPRDDGRGRGNESSSRVGALRCTHAGGDQTGGCNAGKDARLASLASEYCQHHASPSGPVAGSRTWLKPTLRLVDVGVDHPTVRVDYTASNDRAALGGCSCAVSISRRQNIVSDDRSKSKNGFASGKPHKH